MPMNQRNAGRIGVPGSLDGDGNDACSIYGINLTTRSVPVRNEYLEAFLTGRFNVFSSEAPTVITLCQSRRSDIFVDCYYSSIWNVAAKGISFGNNPHDASNYLRALLMDSTRFPNLDDMRDCLLPASYIITREASSARSTTHERQLPQTDPAITDDVLYILAEEGILEEDAKIALTNLIHNGVIRKELLRKGGPLYVYGDDRRHIVSRVLNYINSHRENGSDPEEDRSFPF